MSFTWTTVGVTSAACHAFKTTLFPVLVSSSQKRNPIWLCISPCCPWTLGAFASKPKTAAVGTPGPGPIRKWDWKPIADRYLRDRKVILHKDGARTYKLSAPGVLHGNAVHMKKKMKVAGKTPWVKPRYTKLWAHTLPGGKKLTVKAGTQIIDRFWGHVRAYLKHATRKVGSSSLARKIRVAQWTYWYGKQKCLECNCGHAERPF